MKKDKIFKITITAMFTAMIFLFTRFIQIPCPTGFLHFGDSLIYVCAGLIGGPWAVIAGSLGEGLVDLSAGYASYAPATFIVKALIALVITLAAKNTNKILTWKSAVATIPAGIITVVGYSIADYIISPANALATIPANVTQAAASAIIFIILAAALDKANIKSKIVNKYNQNNKAKKDE